MILVNAYNPLRLSIRHLYGSDTQECSGGRCWKGSFFDPRHRLIPDHATDSNRSNALAADFFPLRPVFVYPSSGGLLRCIFDCRRIRIGAEELRGSYRMDQDAGLTNRG